MSKQFDVAIKEIRECEEQREKEELLEEFDKTCPFKDCPHRTQCLETNEICYALHDLKKILQNLKKMDIIDFTEF